MGLCLAGTITCVLTPDHAAYCVCICLQVLSVDAACTAAAAAVPAVLMSTAALSTGQLYSSTADPATAQLLLTALLQTSAASAATLQSAAVTSAPVEDTSVPNAAAAAAGPGSSSGHNSVWQQQAVSVAQQLLAPTAQAAAQWSPSWQCEAATHALLAAAATGSSSACSTSSSSTAAAITGAGAGCAATGGGMDSAAGTAALAAQDDWRLSQATAVLRQFAAACSAQRSTACPAGGDATGALSCMQLDDAAVFSYLHAMAQLQSVLQVRPHAVVDFMRQHSSGSGSSGSSSGCSSSGSSGSSSGCSSGGEGLAMHASTGLVAAVFALKQLSSSPLLPSELLAPLAKTSVELRMAQAAAASSDQQQQQQQQDLEEEWSGPSGQHAVARASHGLTSLLLSGDPQLRLHAAAAWVQACTSSSSRHCNCGAACATFVPAVRLLLQQQGQHPLSSLLPAWQAVAQIASHLLLQPSPATTAQQASPTTAVSSNTQAVAQVVQLLVQQLSAMQQPDGQVCLTPDAAERVLLLQLLLAHILSQALQRQDQQQQQDAKQKQEAEQAAGSRSEQPAPTSQQQQQQLLSKPLLQQLTPSLLATLQALLPLLQQEQQGSVGEQRLGGAYSVSSPSDESPGRQEGPGGYPNYQSLLSPPGAVSTWGISSSCCGTFLGSSSRGSSSSGEPQGSAWLLDPYLQGGRAGTRLLQALPVQLAAACVDTAHCLLRYGLVQAVNACGTAAAAAGGTAGPASATPVKAAAAAGGGAAWRAVLCHAMDVPALRPVGRLSKQLLLEVSGSASLYKEARAAHLLSRRSAALMEVLNLKNALCSQQQQQQQQEEQRQQVPLQAGPQQQQQQQQVMEQVYAVVSGLQGSWQQQSAVAAALAQLLSVAESQPVCWAQFCCLSSSSGAVSSSAAGVGGEEGVAAAHVVLPLLLQLALQCQIPQLGLVAVKLFNAALSGVVKGSSKSKSSSNSSSSSSKGKPAGGASKGSSNKAASAGKSSSHGSSSRHGGSDKSRVPSLGLDWLLAQQQQQQQQQQGMGEESAPYGGPAPSLLSVFIDGCVVGWPEPQERKEAAKTPVLLHNALGVTSDTAAQSLLLQSVLAAVPAAAPAAGAASLPLFSAAGQLLKTSSTLKDTTSSSSSSADSRPGAVDPIAAPGSAGNSSRGGKGTAKAAKEGQELWQCVSSTAGELFATTAAAAAAMAAQPCGLAYQQLQELTELQHPSSSSSSSGVVGYWLELSECDVAGGRLIRKAPSSAVRLDSIAAELKFGDKQVCLGIGVFGDKQFEDRLARGISSSRVSGQVHGTYSCKSTLVQDKQDTARRPVT